MTRWCRCACAIGAAGAAAGAAAAGAAAAGVLPTSLPAPPLAFLPCANAGPAIARAAAIATPNKRCFIAFVLYGSSGLDNTLHRLALPEGGPRGLRPGQLL